MRASQVTPEAVRWCWFPYIPLGKITVLAGSPGQAKSLATAWLTAAVTTGNGVDCQGSVLFHNAEDDAADTTRPRLEAAGANLDRVWLDPNVNLNADRLSNLCDENKEVRLITVDPIASFLPHGTNSWKATDVRAALEPVRQLAAERSLAVLLVQHLNRRSDAGDALARIADSQGITQLARSVLIWGASPTDPDGDQGSIKALTRAKNNLARSTASATFTIKERQVTGGISAPYLVRGDDTTTTADEVVADHETRSAVDEAAEFLRGALADGPIEAKELRRKARENGITDRTLDRAKKRAGARSEQSRDESGITGWQWSLTPKKTSGDVGNVGDVGDLPQNAKDAKAANNATPQGAAA